MENIIFLTQVAGEYINLLGGVATIGVAIYANVWLARKWHSYCQG